MPLLTQATAFSSGKVIISGEHSVVYGYPALVGAIDLGITAEAEMTAQLQHTEDPYLQHILELVSQKWSIPLLQLTKVNLTFTSTLPQKSGLGSSAAFAHAVFRVLAQVFQVTLTREEIFQLVWQAEQFMHGNSSGVDPAVVVHGGLLRFQKQADQTVSKQTFTLTSAKGLDFFLIDSGAAEESTKDMVMGVAELVKEKPHVYQTLEQLGQVTEQVIKSLDSPTSLIPLIKENQQLLRELGVVGEKAQTMISQIEKIGGAAKVTGAGGKQAGSGFLIAFHPDTQVMENLATQYHWSLKPIVLGSTITT